MVRWIAPLAVALTIAGQAGPPQAPSPRSTRPALLTPAPGAVHVIVFVGVECPISNRYAPEIGRIARDYAAKGVRVFLAFADPELDNPRVQKHTTEFYPDVSSPPYLDRDRSLARAVGAKATPTAAIYTDSGPTCIAAASTTCTFRSASRAGNRPNGRCVSHSTPCSPAGPSRRLKRRRLAVPSEDTREA